MKVKKSTLSALVVGTVLISGVASASNIDPLPIMRNASAIVLGDFHAGLTTHVEGPMYVGGDLGPSSADFTYNGDGVSDLDINGVQGGLIVGGDALVNTLSQTGGPSGDAQIGGAFAGTAVGGLTVNSGVQGIPVADMTSTFKNLSNSLASLGQTPGASFDLLVNNKSVSSGMAGSNGLAVLNIDSSDAMSLFSPMFNENIALNVDPGVTGFIVNVAGTDFSSMNGNQINTQVFTNDLGEARFTILNFFEATGDLNFTSSANGTILAPHAHVHSAPGGMNGLVISQAFTLDGELRPIFDIGGYSGTLPPSEVPLPAGAWLMMAGLGGLMARSRKAAR